VLLAKRTVRVCVCEHGDKDGKREYYQDQQCRVTFYNFLPRFSFSRFLALKRGSSFSSPSFYHCPLSDDFYGGKERKTALEVKVS
jgi:hypothetical protein